MVVTVLEIALLRMKMPSKDGMLCPDASGQQGETEGRVMPSGNTAMPSPLQVSSVVKLVLPNQLTEFETKPVATGHLLASNGERINNWRVRTLADGPQPVIRRRVRSNFSAASQQWRE